MQTRSQDSIKTTDAIQPVLFFVPGEATQFLYANFATFRDSSCIQELVKTFFSLDPVDGSVAAMQNSEWGKLFGWLSTIELLVAGDYVDKESTNPNFAKKSTLAILGNDQFDGRQATESMIELMNGALKEKGIEGVLVFETKKIQGIELVEMRLTDDKQMRQKWLDELPDLKVGFDLKREIPSFFFTFPSKNTLLVANDFELMKRCRNQFAQKQIAEFKSKLVENELSALDSKVALSSIVIGERIKEPEFHIENLKEFLANLSFFKFRLGLDVNVTMDFNFVMNDVDSAQEFMPNVKEWTTAVKGMAQILSLAEPRLFRELYQAVNKVNPAREADTFSLRLVLSQRLLKNFMTNLLAKPKSDIKEKPEQFQSAFQLAMKQFGTGNNVGATANFTKAISIYSNGQSSKLSFGQKVNLAECFAGRAFIRYENEDYKDAIADLDNGIEILSSMAETRELIGLRSKLAGLLERRSIAHLRTKSVIAGLRDVNRAIQVLDDLTSKNPEIEMKLAGCYELRAMHYSIQLQSSNEILDREKAFDIYQKLSQTSYSPAKAELDNAIEELSTVYISNAETSLDNGDTKQAIEFCTRYAKLLAKTDKNLPIPKDFRAVGVGLVVASYEARAAEARAVGQLDKAIQAIDDAVRTVKEASTSNEIEDKSDFPLVLANLSFERSNLLILAKRFDEALTEVDLALASCRKLNSQDSSNFGIAILFRNRGLALLELERFEQASDAFIESIKVIGNDPQTEVQEQKSLLYGFLGKTHQKQGLGLEAAKDFMKSADILDELVEKSSGLDLVERLASIQYVSGSQFCEIGEIQKGLIQLEKAAGTLSRHLAVNEKDQSLIELQSSILNNAAWHYATGPKNVLDPQKAVNYAHLALKALPDDYVKMDTFAAALARNGNYKEAIEKQEKAIELASDKDKIEMQTRLKLYKLNKPYTAEIESSK